MPRSPLKIALASMCIALASSGCLLVQEIAIVDSGALDAAAGDARVDAGACRPLYAVCTGSNQCCTLRCRAVSLSESRCIEQALPDAACGAIGARCSADTECCGASCSDSSGDGGQCR